MIGAMSLLNVTGAALAVTATKTRGQARKKERTIAIGSLWQEPRARKSILGRIRGNKARLGRAFASSPDTRNNCKMVVTLGLGRLLIHEERAYGR
jgi:hypothetical protein